MNVWEDSESGQYLTWVGPLSLIVDANLSLNRLQNVIIDMEVSASTPSPTIDPSVRTILVGHSMGGIVAAETLLAILSDNPIPPAPHTPPPSTAAHTTPFPPSSAETPEIAGPVTFMFPYIQGILAFDTPYLGICPSVIAHGAESHLKTATSAYSTFSEIAGVFGYGAAPKASAGSTKPGPQKLIKEPPAYMAASATEDAAATPVWQRWGKYAMFAGAAGAVAAGGAAVYAKRDQITEGWSWIGSHLEFVGCLMRGEELKARLDKIVSLREDKGVGFGDLVTVLAPKQGAAGHAVGGTGGLLEISGSEERTFCTLPKREKNKACFEKMVNAKAGDEMTAHMTMFHPRENPGYYGMGDRAKEVLVGWVDEAWYEGSEGVAGYPVLMIEDEEGWREVDDPKEGGGEEIKGNSGFGGVDQEKEDEEMEDVALDGEKAVIVG